MTQKKHKDKYKLQFPANDEYFNCDDAVTALFPSYLDLQGDDTEDDKEVSPFNQLTNSINMVNYQYMCHEWGLSDEEFKKWKDSIQ